jgi:phosphoglycerate dehydrogenase-like enzyme
MGATAEEPPPGIDTIERAVDLVFADTVEELAAALPGTDVLFAWRPRGGLLEEAWAQAADLRWVQSASAGVDALLFAGLVDSQVIVTNARGVFDDAIAEYVLGLFLLYAKGTIGVLDRQRRAEWSSRDTEMLSGKCVLVAGAGSIGRAIGRLCKAFGMRIRAVASTARPGDAVFEAIHGPDELTDAVAWADYVVDALPGTAETRGVFDDEVFAAMNPWTRFVNVGRGSTVDQAALVRALERGSIGAAALDVFEEEPPPPNDPVWTAPNLLVSPHMSGDFGGWRESVVELFVENLQRYLLGRPLRNVVDKVRGYVPS